MINFDSYKLPTYLKKLLGENVVVRIEISECRESAHQFRLNEYSSAVSSETSQQDHSLRQFYEILTSQNAIMKYVEGLKFYLVFSSFHSFICSFSLQ